MTADAISVDELKDVRLFLRLFAESVSAEQTRVVIFRPTQRAVIDVEVVEDRDVEIMLTDEQLVNACEEQTAFGSLDHTMIVGARQRHDLADPELAKRRGGHRLILGGIF